MFLRIEKEYAHQMLDKSSHRAVMTPRKRKTSSKHPLIPPPPQNPGKFISGKVEECYDILRVRPFEKTISKCIEEVVFSKEDF